MDPITAGLLAFKAWAELTLELLQSAAPDQKQLAIGWVLSDLAWWRKTLHIDPAKP
jgi:hypothetical protein